jgi:uncharacterized protein
MAVRIESLHVYPIKSCKGQSLQSAVLTETGLANDRRWMLVNGADKFLTQRELPRLALIDVALTTDGARLSAPGMPTIEIAAHDDSPQRTVTVWRDTLQAFDEGERAAEWLSSFLAAQVRLIRFNPAARRVSNPEWTGDAEALNMFSDGYPILLLSEASLADLNQRLPGDVGPLPMNRFRPNIVASGIDAYDEDRIHELRGDGVRLRIVKPCARCKITTTDQFTGEVMGDEPIATLKKYRWNAELRGICFGQNVIVIDGVGAQLAVGQSLDIVWK